MCTYLRTKAFVRGLLCARMRICVVIFAYICVSVCEFISHYNVKLRITGGDEYIRIVMHDADKNIESNPPTTYHTVPTTPYQLYNRTVQYSATGVMT